MYSIQEQFKTNALAQLNSKVRDAQLIAENMLEVSREIGVLNVRTTKASAEVLAGAVQKLLSATNPGEFFQLAAAVMRPDMQVWTSYTEQLRSITGKMTAPLAASLAPAEGYVHAPEASPPEPEPEVEAPAAFAAPAEDAAAAPVEPEPAVEEAAVEPEAVAASPAPGPVASEKAVAEPPPAAGKAEPETPEVIQQVAEAMAGMSKAPPAVLAASAPVKAQAQAATGAPAAAKSPVKPVSRKAPVRQAPQKAGPPARSGARRAKKG